MSAKVTTLPEHATEKRLDDGTVVLSWFQADEALQDDLVENWSCCDPPRRGVWVGEYLNGSRGFAVAFAPFTPGETVAVGRALRSCKNMWGYHWVDAESSELVRDMTTWPDEFGLNLGGILPADRMPPEAARRWLEILRCEPVEGGSEAEMRYGDVALAIGEGETGWLVTTKETTS